VKDAKKHPIVFDEDCQELYPAMMTAFKMLSFNKIVEKI